MPSPQKSFKSPVPPLKGRQSLFSMKPRNTTSFVFLLLPVLFAGVAQGRRSRGRGRGSKMADKRSLETGGEPIKRANVTDMQREGS